MPISQEGENAKIPKRDFVPGGHYAKITKRERVQEGVIAKVFEGVIVLVGDYSRGCTCQALQEGENARGAKMLGGRVSVSQKILFEMETTFDPSIDKLKKVSKFLSNTCLFQNFK